MFFDKRDKEKTFRLKPDIYLNEEEVEMFQHLTGFKGPWKIELQWTEWAKGEIFGDVYHRSAPFLIGSKKDLTGK